MRVSDRFTMETGSLSSGYIQTFWGTLGYPKCMSFSQSRHLLSTCYVPEMLLEGTAMKAVLRDRGSDI